MTASTELLRELRAEVEKLALDDTSELDRLRRKAEMLIRRTLGPDSPYLSDLKKMSFHPSAWISGMDTRPAWNRGHTKFINLIDTIIEEMDLFGEADHEPAPATVTSAVAQVVGDKIFIVHGHDEEMKQSVARMLEKLGLAPLILHEQPNQGRTIIEKLMDLATTAPFAVILLSPDDEARPRDAESGGFRLRARQNVVLELGLFLGLLGRSKVAVLHRTTDTFEMLSDYQGVLFIPYDERGAWKYDLAKELKAAGINVDMNKLT